MQRSSGGQFSGSAKADGHSAECPQDRGDPTARQFLDEVVGMPAVVQRQVPRCQEMTYTEQKVQILHQVVHFPAVAQRLTRMWRRTRTVETTRLQDREEVVDVPLDQDGHISWRKSWAFSRPRRSRVPRRQRICPPLWLARLLQQKKWEC